MVKIQGHDKRMRALRLGLSNAHYNDDRGALFVDVQMAGYLASMVAWLADPLPGARKKALADIDRMIQRGHRRALFLDNSAKISAQLCGKVNDGQMCVLPKSARCPDCGPSIIDYHGE